MVRLISRQRGGLAALKLTKLFEIDDFPAAKDSEKVLIIIIYCYLIIILISISISISIIINRVAERTQHVSPNNVAICFVGMLRSFGRG